MMVVNLTPRPAEPESWEAVDLEAQRVAAGEPCPRCGSEEERHHQAGIVACPVARLVAVALDQEPDAAEALAGGWSSEAGPEADDQEEADDEHQEGTGPDSDRTGWVWACGCLVAGTRRSRTNDPHAWRGWCRTCTAEAGIPVAVYRCGAPQATRAMYACRCPTPDLTDRMPQRGAPPPAGQLRLF